jgi:hypothetical protein
MRWYGGRALVLLGGLMCLAHAATSLAAGGAGGRASVVVDWTALDTVTPLPVGSPERLAASGGRAPPRPPAPPAPAAAADRRFAITGFGGVSIDDVPFSETVLQPWNGTWGSDTFVGLAGSYQLARFWRWFTVEPELGVGGRFGDTGSVEAWAALYVRFDGFPWREHLYTTVAASTGLNWISTLPAAEAGTPGSPEPYTSQVLHYFAPEISFALPRHRQYELVLRYHHRSGIFGAINGVEDGSNVIAFGFRYRLPVH